MKSSKFLRVFVLTALYFALWSPSGGAQQAAGSTGERAAERACMKANRPAERPQRPLGPEEMEAFRKEMEAFRKEMEAFRKEMEASMKTCMEEAGYSDWVPPQRGEGFKKRHTRPPFGEPPGESSEEDVSATQ